MKKFKWLHYLLHFLFTATQNRTEDRTWKTRQQIYKRTFTKETGFYIWFVCEGVLYSVGCVQLYAVWYIYEKRRKGE